MQKFNYWIVVSRFCTLPVNSDNRLKQSVPMQLVNIQRFIKQQELSAPSSSGEIKWCSRGGIADIPWLART